MSGLRLKYCDWGCQSCCCLHSPFRPVPVPLGLPVPSGLEVSVPLELRRLSLRG